MAIFATIGAHEVRLDSFDVITIVAKRAGFDDIDLEPQVNGFSLTAKKTKGEVVKVNGRTIYEVCSRFCDRVLT